MLQPESLLWRDRLPGLLTRRKIPATGGRSEPSSRPLAECRGQDASENRYLLQEENVRTARVRKQPRPSPKRRVLVATKCSTSRRSGSLGALLPCPRLVEFAARKSLTSDLPSR